MRNCPWCLAGFEEPVPHAVLPCPAFIQEEKLSLTSILCAMPCSSPWKAGPFLNGDQGGMSRRRGSKWESEWGEEWEKEGGGETVVGK